MPALFQTKRVQRKQPDHLELEDEITVLSNTSDGKNVKKKLKGCDSQSQKVVGESRQFKVNANLKPNENSQRF